MLNNTGLWFFSMIFESRNTFITFVMHVPVYEKDVNYLPFSLTSYFVIENVQKCLE